MSADIGDGRFIGAVTTGPRPPPAYESELAKWIRSLRGGTTVTVSPGSGAGALAPANTINNVAVEPSKRQLQVAGVGNVLRLFYGQVRVGADIALIRYYNDAWYVLAVWGKGPIEAVAQYWINDADPDASVTATHYTGTDTQVADVTLRTLLAAEGRVYADALVDIAYSVFVVPAAVSAAGFPTFSALIQGRKLYDPRADSTNGGSGSQRLATASTWTYSNNPALALADFRCKIVGRSMNWASVATAADDCDYLCGVAPTQEKKRLIALALEQSQAASAWTDTLRTYAGCMVVPDAGGEMLVPVDAGVSSYGSLLLEPGGTDFLLLEGSADDHLLLEPTALNASDFSFAHTSIVAGTLKAKKRGIQQVPRYVEVAFTDTGSTPYIQGYATALATGLTWATAAPSRISLTGITRYSQALREAIERLNQFLLADLSVTFTSQDERALSLQVGTIIDVTSSVFGWVAKAFRIDVAPAMKSGAGIARYDISATEYDPAIYSTLVSSNPTTPDTTLDTPNHPPQVTGLSVAEEPYVEQYRVTATQARLTWTRPTWPFLHSYSVIAYLDVDGVNVKQWETIVLPSGETTESAVTPALRPGELYSLAVAVRSSVATGTPVYIGLRPLGKSDPPSDVASISGFSVGGETFLSWAEGTDDDQIHIRYWLKYSATGGTWDDATTIQKIAALHYSVPGIPVGTWRFWIKAVDSIGQVSDNAAYVDLVVSETGPFAVDSVTLADDDVVSMESCDVATQSEPRWLSATAPDVMGYGHVDTTDATGVWVDANILVGTLFANPRTATAGHWQSATYDAGAIITASWAAELPYRTLAGSPVFKLQLSDDDIVYVDYVGGIALDTPARYARVLFSFATTDVVAIDGYATLQVVQVGAGSLRPSAVTTEALVSDTSVTVTIGGTTYKLLARA